MTLLEALVALVILGLAGVGFLETFGAASRSTQDAQAWVEAVALAEAAMEETKLGALAEPQVGLSGVPAGFAGRVDVEPWLETPGVELVTVTITLPDGGAFELHRLVRVP